MLDNLKSRFKIIESYCETLHNTKVEFQIDWNATKFLIHDKMYALIGFDNKNKPLITLRQDPSQSYFLQKQYDFIVPGYYMNKLHWISIYLDSEVDDYFIKQLIRDSYINVIKTLPKKLQKLIDIENLP